MAVVFGPKSHGPDPTIDELIEAWTQTSFLIFFGTLTGIAIIDYIGVKYYERLNFMDQEQTKIVYGEKFLMISYVSLAAYFGSVNVLFMKFIVVILATWTWDYLEAWFFYVVIVGIIVLNLSLEFFRQRALAYFGALFVVPIYQVLLILGAAMMGAVYFNEFVGMSTLDLIIFISAIVMTLIGVAILAFTVGKYMDQFWKFVSVAWLKEYELLESSEGTQIVWPGAVAEYMQNFYLTHDPFCYNKKLPKVDDGITDTTDDL